MRTWRSRADRGAAHGLGDGLAIRRAPQTPRRGRRRRVAVTGVGAERVERRRFAELDVGDISHASHGRDDFGVQRPRVDPDGEVRVESFRLELLERRLGSDHFTERLERLHDEKGANAAELRVRL